MTASDPRFLGFKAGRYLMRFFLNPAAKELSGDERRPFVLRDEGGATEKCLGERCDLCAAFGQTQGRRHTVPIRNADGTTGIWSVGPSTFQKIRQMMGQSSPHLQRALVLEPRRGLPRSMTLGRLLERLVYDYEDFDFGPTPSSGLSPRKWDAYYLNMLPPDPRCSTCSELNRGPHGIGCL